MEYAPKLMTLPSWTLWDELKPTTEKLRMEFLELVARGLAEVGIEVSSDAIWKQVKKRGGKLLAEASLREDTAPSLIEDTAPVQEICANQESEVSPLYGT